MTVRRGSVIRRRITNRRCPDKKITSFSSNPNEQLENKRESPILINSPNFYDNGTSWKKTCGTGFSSSAEWTPFPPVCGTRGSSAEGSEEVTVQPRHCPRELSGVTDGASDDRPSYLVYLTTDDWSSTSIKWHYVL